MTPIAPKEDARLVAETLAGSEAAFATLVERHQDRLFGLIRHYVRGQAEVEDVVQEAFLKAFSKLNTYQSRSSFSTWLQRIAVNTALDLHKRRGRSPVQTVEDPEATGGPLDPTAQGSLPPPDKGLESAELREITQSVLEKVPEVFRNVLVLREFEELSYLEIAELLDVSIGTVESRLSRARSRFREALLELHPELHRELSGPNPAAPRKRRRLGSGKGPAKATKAKRNKNKGLRDEESK